MANELCLTGTLASTDFGRAKDSLTSMLAVTMKAAAKKSERISGSTKKEAIFGFLKSVYKDHPTTFYRKDGVSTASASFTNQGGSIEQLDVTDAQYPLVVPKVGRNRRCPCGSGKKYKRCCGRTPTVKIPQQQ